MRRKILSFKKKYFRGAFLKGKLSLGSCDLCTMVQGLPSINHRTPVRHPLPTLHVVTRQGNAPYITVQIRASCGTCHRLLTCPYHHTRHGDLPCHGLDDTQIWKPPNHNAKQGFFSFQDNEGRSGLGSAFQKVLKAVFSGPDLCPITPIGRRIADFAKE